MNLSRIQEMAGPYMEYDMITDYTELPPFPELRIQLLLAFLIRNKTPERTAELYALVTSLVQMGLDIHDLVPETNTGKGKKASRSRQLKVLAGDYFSSRFYQLLAQTGDIEMIRHLSLAIREVNRLKTNLYQSMKQFKLTAEDYIQHSVGIHMQLFLSFQDRLSGNLQRIWPDLLQTITRCEVIVREMFRLHSSESVKDGWAYWYIMQSGTKEDKKQLQADEPDAGKLRSILLKYKLDSRLYQMLQEQADHLWTAIRQLHQDSLGMELYGIGEYFSRYLNKSKVSEEL